MNLRPSYTPAFLVLTGLLFAATAWPQGAASAPADIPRLEFEKYVLPNGLQVILHVDRKLPMVNVNLWYHVGSKNERFGRTGFAHLFEHMMFEGSQNANSKYFGFIEKAGANLFEGGVNGTTSTDRTNYFETVPAANLEFVLWLESDRLATLTEALTQKKLDNERDIVKNERRQGLENQPYGRWYTLVYENVFPYGHPYAHSVIGSHEDLTAATADDVKDFFHTYYTPNNLSLAITGDFEPAQVKQLVQKYFGPIAPGPALDRPKHWAPVLSGEKILDVKDHVAQERTYFAWPSPAYFDAGDAEMDLTSLILTDGLSARLNKSLVYEKQLASDTVAFQDSQEMASSFIIWATARPGVALPQVEKVVTEEIARLAKEGPSPEELNRAKTKWEFQYVTGLERIGGFGGQADVLNQYNTFLGDPDQFATDVQRHRSVTNESLQLAAAKWLDTSNRVLVRFHPEAATLEAGTPLDRSKQPAFGQDRPFQVPVVKTAKLDNGLRIFVVERNNLPKIAVTLATRAGSISDPAGKEGLAALAVEAMKRGTTSRKALEIDEAVGNLGTSLNGYASLESATLSFESLKRNLSPGLALLSDVARNPSFAGDEVDREKKKSLDALAQDENHPDSIARRVGPMLAFGRDHVYGRPGTGYRSTVEKITPADLADFHRAYWKPGSSALVFVGDVSLEEAVNLSKSAFGAWSGGAAPDVLIPPPHPAAAGMIYLVNRPAAAQTFISEILQGPTRGASEYYAFTLADAVWGGGAGARLGMNLREDKGYSYGVFSFPRVYSKYTLWNATGGVQTNKTKESVVEFQKELKFIAGGKPVSEEELANAKNARIRGYAQQFESLSRVADQVVELWTLDRPMSDLEKTPEGLSQANRSAVNAAAEKYASPSHAALLLVGDSSKIEAGVRELDGASVVLLDTEGRPVTKN